MSGSISAQQALRAQNFVQSIGVCAGLDNSSSSYANVNGVQSQLQYIGVNNVRAGTPWNNLASYQQLGAAGIKFDLIPLSTDLTLQMSLIDSIAPYVKTVEGPNEVDMAPVGYNGLSGVDAAVAFQKNLYAQVHADPKLAGVKVLPFSVSVNTPDTAYGNVAPYVDYGNAHGYASSGVPPYWMLNYVVSHVSDTPAKPVIMTETGYYTMLDNNGGVNQDVQAKWIVDTLLENYSRNGVPLTYVYQLEDGFSDQPGEHNLENHWGLYNVDGTAKQSAVALHNLTTLLGDTGATASSFAPGSLAYAVDGLSPDYGFQALFAKSDGSFDLALWSEPQIWDPTTNSETVVAASPVTVSLGQTAAMVRVFDVLSGTTPIATYTNTNSIQLSFGTDPIIVQITPGGSGGTSTSSAPVFTTAAASAAGGPLRLGEKFSLTLTPSAPVVVDTTGGAPTLTLSDGGVATYDAALSSASALVFDTAVTAGQSTSDLKITGLALNGAKIANSAGMALDASGLVTLAGSDTGLAVETRVSPVSVGSGPNAIVLNVSEDAWNGDAQFTVAVDGQQVGGTLTATAQHGAGQSQAFTLNGSFATGTHSVAVTFLNDGWGGSAAQDRNLYVDRVTLGSTVVNANAVLATTGTQTFNVTAATTPPVVTVGSGIGTITVKLAEDAWNGDAQFAFTVDGVKVGATQTTTALHGQNQLQSFALKGSFVSGAHNVGVTLLNPASGGAGQTRDVYVDSLLYRGLIYAPHMTLASGSQQIWAVTDTVSAPVTVGSGPNSLVVNVSEDAWKGDAQFTVTVDGKQIGGVQTATAQHANGQTQAFTFAGTFGSGSHAVGVTFLNDAWGKVLGADRNLYVDSIASGSSTLAAKAELASSGTRVFTVGAASQPVAAAAFAPVTVGASAAPATSTDTSPTGSPGHKKFVVQAGHANGETITNLAHGDLLDFHGYGLGASVTRADPTSWTVSSASGHFHDVIHLALANTAPVGMPDYKFS